MQKVWTACYDQTAVDHYDQIEITLWHEDGHGLT